MAGIFRILSAVLYGVITPIVAAATGVTLQASMAGVTAPVIGLVFTLASVLGLASLLNQLKDKTPERFWIFVAAHMTSSWAGGIFAFIISEWYDWSDWAEVALICACAYAGTRALDLMSERVLTLLPEQKKPADDAK